MFIPKHIVKIQLLIARQKTSSLPSSVNDAHEKILYFNNRFNQGFYYKKIYDLGTKYSAIIHQNGEYEKLYQSVKDKGTV